MQKSPSPEKGAYTLPYLQTGSVMGSFVYTKAGRAYAWPFRFLGMVQFSFISG